MTTNQTIDGVLVPRELLSKALLDAQRVRFPTDKQVIELRALLDAPTEQFNPNGWSIDNSAGRPILVHNNCSVIEAEQAYGLLDLIKAAAQPQGEPVAWMFKYLSHSDSPPYRSFEVTDFHQNPKAPGIAQHTPLYAEQPAPVAVSPSCCGSCPGGCAQDLKA